ncbi:MAG: tripartite tricarboxylate transporter substrate binding protein, partial [Noviherbaspirillum sp.]|nr:tripartite tricarboxylate transporter substrate binding protein [Noviherbaspirillum sp.]
LSIALPALAQSAADYPNKMIKFIVPLPAGGGFDNAARMLAEKFRQKWGQTVVVENRPGAASNIGAETAFRAAPDGYTLLFTPPAPLVINKSVYPKLAYDPDAFVPIGVIAMAPNVLLVHPKVPANNVQQLIELAKANPDKLNYASGGSGATPHLTSEWFKLASGTKITHVPYKGNVNAHLGLLQGQVDMMFGELSSALPVIRMGTARALAVGSEKRSPFLPDVPAMSEVLPGFVSMSWLGVVAPPGTPPAIANKLSSSIAEILKQPDIAKQFHDMSFEAIGSTPAEMTQFLKAERERWGNVIRITKPAVE